MPISLLDTLLGDWKKLLTDWAGSGTLARAASEALLLKAEPEPLKKLVGQWSHGDFSGLPPIVLLPASSMPGAAGAYAISTGSIYINKDWLAGASAAQAIAVLTEELGHHLDGLLNTVDTPGDEGKYFALLLNGQPLDKIQKVSLRTQGDFVIVQANNLRVLAEGALVSKSLIKVNGAALQDMSAPVNKVRLLSVPHGTGSAWWNQPIDLAKDWSSTFYVTAFNGSGTSDGFTFAINGDSRGVNAIGDGGGNLGFFGYDSKVGVSNSYAILFDMWTTQPTSLLGFAGSSITSIAQGNVNTPVSLTNNAYNVEIVYKSTLRDLSVSIGGQVFRQNIDLQSSIGKSAFLGFTAANGGGTMGTDVSNWDVIASGSAPAPTIRGNSIYTLVDGPSWTQAEANSVKLGGHLTAITSQSEQDFIKTAPFPSNLSLWIGLNDGDVEAIWKWTSGEVYDYSFWSSGNPSNSGSGEDYVNLMPIDGISWDYRGPQPREWNDWNENDPRVTHGITEIPFIRRGDSAYVIVQGPTWEEAEANAVKLGGHLVTINDAAENQWIQSNFNSYISKTSGGADFWIGYTDKDQEGVWKWLDGSPSTYINWAGTVPDNRIGSYPTYDTTYTSTQYWMGAQAPSDPTGEDYADINAVHGMWNDVARNHRDASVGIAEIKLAPNKKPTGTPALSGIFKSGQIISIDKSPIQDADNFTGWIPTYTYAWEVSSNNGITWTRLMSADAIDNNTTYSLTAADVGKKIRSIVGYVDGYGSSESVESAASIGILANNSAPTGVAFSAYAFNENIIAGSAIATLTGTDPDVGNTFVYSLVAGTGSTDNAAFSIAGDQIKIKASPNFEVKPSYSIRVRTTDQGGLFFDKSITLAVNNVNEAPIAIIASAIKFDENIAAGSPVASLSTADHDAGNTFTYALVAGAGSSDNASFTISGDQIKINASPNFEAKSSYSIRVRTTDQGGLFFDRSIAFAVNNLVEKVSASVSMILAVDKDTLELTGTGNIFGRGNQAANWITGNLGKNKLTGGFGKDVLTGAGGVDTFFYGSLKESLLSGFDVITDYAAGEKIGLAFDFEGDDLIASAGSINALGATQISTLLASTTFLANTAEAFTVQGMSGTFLALNDAVAGFQAGNDALIHLSNYTISASNPVSIL